MEFPVPENFRRIGDSDPSVAYYHGDDTMHSPPYTVSVAMRLTSIVDGEMECDAVATIHKDADTQIAVLDSPRKHLSKAYAANQDTRVSYCEPVKEISLDSARNAARVILSVTADDYSQRQPKMPAVPIS